MVTTKTVKDVCPHEFVCAYAAHLKCSGKIKVPLCVDIVKTATLKELAPYDPNWFYIRTTSMARVHGGIGVDAFRKIYGGRKSNGTHPSHFGKSSGAITREVLKQLQKIAIVEKDPRGDER
ncbi:hypothetical protein KP509_06G089600 [Ceratopteris richardii]|uniref:40S ribosomal protein S19 n=1 Tax=Ceratopteris richardii TaxID=49495 RepID=A0A8T2UIR7_CERRI|nr:hypothetical protein KP509_06G089600 [Ceratopteris richardii]